MFSWIIKWKAEILEINSWNFKIKNIFDEKLKIWESISHDWACMTITEINDNFYAFFVMEESLKKTSFSNKKSWDFFNVESSVRFWGKIDGHIVSGHIDWAWKVDLIEKKADNSKVIFIKFNPKFQNLIIEKWSITVNWVSLTIVEVWKDFFSISIIPLTQEITNLWNLEKGDFVNLEFDMMWKYVEKIMKNKS